MNKGVKHDLDYAETLTASVDFNGPNPQKEWGASYLPAPRTYKLLTTGLVPAVGTVTSGDGPSGILRARNDLIEETAIVIFGDHLDAWTITVHIADCKRSAIRGDDRIPELVRAPVVLVRS